MLFDVLSFSEGYIQKQSRNAVAAVRKICGIYGDDARVESNVHK